MKKDIENILIKKFRNEILSNSEHVEFDTWISLDNNKEIYNEYKIIWSLTKNPISHNFNIDLEWEKLKSKTIDKKKNSKLRFNNKFTVAASIILLIGLFSTINYFFNNKEIKYTSQNSIMAVYLPDNTKVTLNKNTELILSTHFNNKNREVTLNGEAFFSIHKDSLKPFIINLGNNTNVTVLGTKFNLKNYKYLNDIGLEVVSGRVLFVNNTNKVIVKKGNGINFIRNKKEFTNIRKIDNNKLSWRTNTLRFNNVPITKVITELEYFLNKDIKLPNDVTDKKYTGIFKNATEKDIISTIALAMSWEYIVKKDTICFINKD